MPLLPFLTAAFHMQLGYLVQPQFSLLDDSLHEKWHKFLYRPDTLTAIQLTLSKHWRKLKALTPTKENHPLA